MEKAAVAKLKSKLSMFLPKAAAVLKLHNHPFSIPAGKLLNANELRSHQNKGFSGPFSSMVFEEARRNQSKNSSFDAKEPTSPKISCMGQIKHMKNNKKKKKKKKKEMAKNKNSTSLIKELVNRDSSFPEYSRNKPSSLNDDKGKKKKLINSRDILIIREEPRRKSDASAESSASHNLPDRAPSLSQMKRFSSGRDTFSKFDWIQIAPEDSDNRRYFSDEEKRDYEEEEYDDDDEVRIPFSAPLILGEVGPAALPLEPRKEINLWKRRTMSQPKPLQLNT